MRRSSGLYQLLLLVLLLLVPSPARALAPMCDPSGASVEAPLPAPPSRSGIIFADVCPAQDEGARVDLKGHVPRDPRTQPQLTGEYAVLLLLESVRLGRACTFDPLDRDEPGPVGVCDRVFRPPRF